MINLLSQDTIDKIAAGEVVESPASCLKELCENSIDAGAKRINAQIREGGVALMRVSDDGCGMDEKDIPLAFVRHATSKIRDASDLMGVMSLGFRGEALSSISAVSRVEMITKTEDAMMALRYECEGGGEAQISQVGAPTGTTIIIRDLFFNTPARKKFLKSAAAEGARCQEVMERLALSHPDIAFSFENSGRTLLQTWGSGDLRDVIYQVYGRDIASRLIPLKGDFVSGYIAAPDVSASNRSREAFFVNGRYVKESQVLSKALEEAFMPYMMQHRFPFGVICFEPDPGWVDVNIHPRKLQVRFSDNPRVFELVKSAVASALAERELIPATKAPEAVRPEAGKTPETAAAKTGKKPDGAGSDAGKAIQESQADRGPVPLAGKGKPAEESGTYTSDALVADMAQAHVDDMAQSPAAYESRPRRERPPMPFENSRILRESASYGERVHGSAELSGEEAGEQLSLFGEGMLTRKARDEYRILGQAFDTYWIVQSGDKLLLVDQHAAHEKVLYERFVKQIKESGVFSQQLMPPIIVTLSPGQRQILTESMEMFEELGFEIEEFGDRDYCLRAVPENFSSINSAELFMELLEDMTESGGLKGTSETIRDRIATKACKAAVKGNNAMSEAEFTALMEEMMELDNPYNCPHGRPTMLTMSRYELEKRFKRIV